MNRIKLLRSMLFVPAYNEHYIQKAVKCDADALILDLEDAVPEQMKGKARRTIREYHQQGAFRNKVVFVRVNSLETAEFVLDMESICLPDIAGFLPPKVKEANDICFFDRLLDYLEIKNGIANKHFLLAPIIETSSGISNVDQIAFSSKRIVAMCFGGEDYLNDLGSVYTYQEEAFVYPRARIVNAARSAGLLPIDTPFIMPGEMEKMKAHCARSFRNGFEGSLLISPRHIAIANQTYMPDKEMTDWAREIVQSVESSRYSGGGDERGILVVDGMMVGPPMVKRAKTIVQRIKDGTFEE